MSPRLRLAHTLLNKASRGSLPQVLVRDNVVEYVFIVAFHNKSF